MKRTIIVCVLYPCAFVLMFVYCRDEESSAPQPRECTVINFEKCETGFYETGGLTGLNYLNLLEDSMEQVGLEGLLATEDDKKKLHPLTYNFICIRYDKIELYRYHYRNIAAEITLAPSLKQPPDEESKTCGMPSNFDSFIILTRQVTEGDVIDIRHTSVVRTSSALTMGVEPRHEDKACFVLVADASRDAWEKHEVALSSSWSTQQFVMSKNIDSARIVFYCRYAHKYFYAVDYFRYGPKGYDPESEYCKINNGTYPSPPMETSTESNNKIMRGIEAVTKYITPCSTLLLVLGLFGLVSGLIFIFFLSTKARKRRMVKRYESRPFSASNQSKIKEEFTRARTYHHKRPRAKPKSVEQHSHV